MATNYLKLAGIMLEEMGWNPDAIPELAAALQKHFPPPSVTLEQVLACVLRWADQYAMETQMEEIRRDVTDLYAAPASEEDTSGALPSRHENPQGLHARYHVEKLYGKTDPNAVYFVLRLDSGGDDKHHINACRWAAKAYCEEIIQDDDAHHLWQMAKELMGRISNYETEDANTTKSAPASEADDEYNVQLTQDDADFIATLKPLDPAEVANYQAIQCVEPAAQPAECDFERELSSAINRHSQENASNTPDYILAQFMAGCLSAFNTATQQRETWHGRDARPSNLQSESWLRKAADEEDKHASIAVGVPPADEGLRAEIERLREEIKAKDNRILSLIVENRQPHPERDFVKECNEALATKNKYIAELERQVGEARSAIRGLVDELESPSMRRAIANARTILAPPQTEGA